MKYHILIKLFWAIKLVEGLECVVLLPLGVARPCEGESVTLQCPDNTFMKVIKAVYGRTADGDSVCPMPTDPTRTENTGCQSTNSMKVIKYST